MSPKEKKLDQKKKSARDELYRKIAEGMFDDFYKRRHRVYWFNLIRGIFFGFGSVLGGTILVALVLWLLNQFADLPGGIGDFVQNVIDSMRSK